MNKSHFLSSATKCLTVALGILSYLGAGGALTVGSSVALATTLVMGAAFYFAAYKAGKKPSGPSSRRKTDEKPVRRTPHL